MLRLQDNPSMIWPLSAKLAEIELPWSVAYCKPRQEKALANDLTQREIPYFLPMLLRETSSGGRRRRNLYPLFSSYLFFAGGERERLAALRTERIVHIIDVAETDQAQLRQEITSLEIALRSCPESIELHPRLVAGVRVRITSGPMKDVEGIILQTQKKRKLLLGVSVLGVGATVEIHADLVGLE